MSSETSPAPRDTTALYMPLSIVIAGALVGAGLFFGLSSAGGSSGGEVAPGGPDLITTKQQMQAAIKKGRMAPLVDTSHINKTDIVLGRDSAPLTMTYWFDYQCPFCKQVEETVLPTLIEKYINPGKLKLVLKDYPFLGNDSMTAAEYSHAIWELYPQAFYAWHAAMFDVQDTEGDQGFGDEATVQTLTGLIPGIDVGKVKALVAEKKTEYDTTISAERDAGSKAGVQGTPGFVVGTKSIDGAQPLANFTEAIDSQLK